MLFGEYSLMCGSAALTLPFSKNFVELQFPGNSLSSSDARFARYSNNQLKSFLEYLKGLHDLKGVGFSFYMMEVDLAAGLFLWSNIPKGYGLGSSGALVAAIYHRYARKSHVEPFEAERLTELKNIFAQMEAFFHGSSSGLDPLSSYVKKPLLINGQHGISVMAQKLPVGYQNGGFFLLDTLQQRNTKLLVGSFREKCQNARFLDRLKTEYIPLNNACINAVVENKTSLYELIKQLSGLQVELFGEMVPPAFQKTWASGLASGSYALKLCGAGGGGFLLGFADDYSNIHNDLREHAVVLLKDFF